MASDCLDHKLCQEMEKYVEELTTSGRPILDAELMKKLKKICRISDAYVKHCFHLLLTQLEEQHSEVRLSTFQTIDELFNRSHVFRELLMSKFQVFLELTVGIEYNIPLPPPKAAAENLKRSTLKAIQQWYDKYGQAYKKLCLGFNFLKTCKKVDFDDIRAQSQAEQMREQQRKEKQEKFNNMKIDQVLNEMKDVVYEIQNALKEVHSCFEIIVPRPDDFFISTEMNSEISDKELQNENLVINAEKSCQKKKSDGGKMDSTDTLSMVTEFSGKAGINSVGDINGETKNDNHCIDDTENDSKLPDDNNYPTHCIQHVEDNVDSESEREMEDFEYSEPNIFVQEHGLGTRQYALDIEIPQNNVSIIETDDNRDILLTLRDNYCLIKSKFQPKVSKWLKILSKSGAKQEHLTKVIDLKTSLEQSITRFHELKIIENLPNLTENLNAEDSDDDFEEVPEKEGYEEKVQTVLKYDCDLKTQNKTGCHRKTPSDWSMRHCVKKEDENDPTTLTANLAKVLGQEELHRLASWDESKPSTSTGTYTISKQSASYDKKKLELLNKAPVVPYGIDLEHWENPDKIEAPPVMRYDADTLHRFWIPKDVETHERSDSGIASLTNRSFNYVGKFEPVKWKCRAPVSNGKLCERMDRIKCPFHGEIIARDEFGYPSDPKKLKKIEYDPEPNEIQDWHDPELLAEIEAATGADLGLGRTKGKGKGKGKGKSKGKGKGKNKYPNLTDIKKIKNTARNRLEKKVFNKSSAKRVAAVMNAADYKRVRDKFANQFNYSMPN